MRSMPKKIKLNLRTKIMIWVGCIVSTVLGAGTLLQVKELRSSYLEAIGVRSEALAGVIINDLKSLNETSDNIAWMTRIQTIHCIQLYEGNKNKEIDYFAVLDSSGTYAAHSDLTARGTKPAGAQLKGAISSHMPTTVLGSKQYHTLIPVYGKEKIHLGTIAIGASRNIVDKRVGKLLWYSFALFCGFLTIVFFAISLMVHLLLLKPIAKLTESASSMADGDLDRSMDTGRWDEIGMLGRSFARMRDAIKKQMAALNAEIIQRKRVESEIRRLNESLEQMVRERTTELEMANDALRTSKDAAETANKAKSVFLANMSHELRTPLNAVLGFSDILMRNASAGREFLTPTQTEHLAIVHRSGEHLLTLINNVLELSRIESGRDTVETVQCNLHQLLFELVDMFKLKASDKGLALRVGALTDLPMYVKTDEIKVRQILINLLGNAVKFTEQGQVMVRAGACSRAATASTGPETTWIFFEISDTGVGIDEKELDFIFAPFAQAASHGKKEGTGLGLAISREFVNLLGGEITVRSRRGKGAVFAFEIPVETVPTSAVSPEVENNVIVGLAPGGPTYRILIVDDNPQSRKLLHGLLQPLGFELHEAENGQKAIEKWETYSPQLIWMDLRMPVLNGYEATGHIKKSPGGDKTKILALTASSFEDEREKILEAGCDDFLRKPFAENDIFQMLVRHLGVQYVYGENKVAGAEPESRKRLEPGQPAVLPSELKRRLQQAAVELNPKSVQDVIQEIERLDTVTASIFKRYAGNFDFGGLLDLLNSTNAEKE